MASDHVRVLGVTAASTNMFPACICGMFLLTSANFNEFDRRRSLDGESAKTLVHAFVTARVDYCNKVLAGAPRSVTDRLQRSVERASMPTTVDYRSC